MHTHEMKDGVKSVICFQSSSLSSSPSSCRHLLDHPFGKLTGGVTMPSHTHIPVQMQRIRLPAKRWQLTRGLGASRVGVFHCRWVSQSLSRPARQSVGLPGSQPAMLNSRANEYSAIVKIIARRGGREVHQLQQQMHTMQNKNNA